MLTYLQRQWLVLSAGVLLGTALLTGCGTMATDQATASTAEPDAVTSVTVHGQVHGGAYPIQGANIELWQTGVGAWNTSTKSYAPSFLNSSTNSNFIASTTSASAGDGSGRPPGYFDFGTQSLACKAGSYLYLTQTAGESVPNKANENDSVIQVAAIGKCQDLTNVEVYMSELSTIAAAYTLNNFISIDTDPNTRQQRVNITAPVNNTANGGCTGLGTSLTCTGSGLANGFANALNLVDSLRTDGSFPSGLANATIPGNTGAIAPRAMVNALGNVLQSCVDSGPSTVAAPSSVCSTLYNYSPTGYNSSSAPTAGAPLNTLQVAINIARNPAPSNVATLFSLAAANGPFTPALSAAPSSFTVSILYPSNAVGDTTFSKPVDVALDDNDNVYVAYSKAGALTNAGALAALNPNGMLLFGGAQAPATNPVQTPATLAVDPNGNIWMSDNTANATNLLKVGNIIGFTSGGAYYNAYTVPYGQASGVSFDNAGAMFATRNSTDTNVNDFIYKAGSMTKSQSGTVIGTPLMRAAVDSYGTFKSVGVNKFVTLAPVPKVNTSTNAACAAAIKYAESSVSLDTSGGMAIAIDTNVGNYNTFLPITNELATGNVTIAGGQPTQCWAATTTYNNYAGKMTTNSVTSNAAVLDGSGNLFWNNSAGKIYELAGAEAAEGSTGGTLGGSYVSMAPCLLANGATACAYPTSLAGMAVDSSGAMWQAYAPSSGAAYVVQTFGLAAPTWPLLAYEKAGAPF